LKIEIVLGMNELSWHEEEEEREWPGGGEAMGEENGIIIKIWVRNERKTSLSAFDSEARPWETPGSSVKASSSLLH
jgi:hypothetical protein